MFSNHIKSTSLGETKKFAAEFLNTLAPGREATVVALVGELGAGKTFFVSAMAELLGIPEKITSPTFVIMKRFMIPAFTKVPAGKQDLRFKGLVHVDAYRLNTHRDLLYLGFEEILKYKNNLIFIEWPERVSEIVPREAIKIHFTFVDETTREIEILN